MRAIEIIIDPQGGIQIEAVNFRGPDCEQATRFLEEALGQLKERRRKPEYLSRAKTKTQQRVGG
jgi:hypothetical protein